MNTRIIILLWIIGISLMLATPVFTQPSISVGAGPPYTGGFSVSNSDRIIFGFYTDPGISDAVIPMTLPSGISTFVIKKGGFPCVIEDSGGCYGSFVEVPALGPGSITVSGGAAADFVIDITSAASPGSGNWQANSPTNAAINFVRAIPNININYPAEVLSGDSALVTLDASGTTPTYAGTIAPVPSISSYSWSSTVALSSTTSSAPTFSVPSVTVNTDLTFQLTVTDNAGLTAIKTIIVTVLARQNPIDAVLLIDTSGSMGWYHDGSTHDLAGGCCSRLASAKAAAKYFVNRLETFASDSRLGVAIFPAEPAPGPNYGDRYAPATDLAVSTGFSAIETDIGGETQSCDCTLGLPGTPGVPSTGSIPVNWNGTPTEAGLIAATNMLTTASSSSGRERIIILLSDGAWNVGNDPTLPVVISPLTTAGIYVYTIGMGTGSDNVEHGILEDISVATSIGSSGNPFGFFQYNLGITADSALFNYFEKIMAHMVTLDFTVDPPATIKPGKINAHKVLITSHDSILSFTVSWKSSQVDLLDFTVITPDGKRLKPQVSGNGYKNLTIGRRMIDNLFSIGEWTIEVTGKSKKAEIAYNYSVMTKSELNMKILLNKEKFYTGDTLLLEARLIEDNRRLKGSKVIAKIKRPEIGIGNWHFENTVSQNQLLEVPDKISGEPLTLLDKKNYVLLEQRKVALPEIITEPEIILNDEGIDGDKYPNDGIYTAQYEDFSVPGLYKFQIYANGTTYNKQEFSRENEVQKMVEVRPDSEITVSEGDIQIIPKENTGIMTIRVTPLDKNKNYLGPGYAEKIIIRSSDGKPAGQVEDLLNGTYQQQFIIHDTAADPHITISVRGEQVYNGPYSELTGEGPQPQLPYRWEVSIHAGYPILHGSFENILNPGISGILDLNYHITNLLSVELLLGCHYFFEDEVGDSFYWLNASVNGKVSVPIGIIKIFANAGSGVYIDPDRDQYFGWNAGGGLAFAIGNTSHIELGYNYHSILDTVNNEFSVIQLGVRFGF